jgi:hypothetical protein
MPRAMRCSVARSTIPYHPCARGKLAACTPCARPWGRREKRQEGGELAFVSVGRQRGLFARLHPSDLEEAGHLLLDLKLVVVLVRPARLEQEEACRCISGHSRRPRPRRTAAQRRRGGLGVGPRLPARRSPSRAHHPTPRRARGRLRATRRGAGARSRRPWRPQPPRRLATGSRGISGLFQVSALSGLPWGPFSASNPKKRGPDNAQRWSGPISHE